ncbi:hypothetical protein FJZ17_01975 [Candidatus Pacearchaeota archaeon]|nr:hypothetical protein [Candidatus Pacearchaeota archaeon]
MSERGTNRGGGWTETYHSWGEYVQKHPDWDKYPSTRLAAAFAREELETNGVCVRHCFRFRFNSVTHREVNAYLRRLARAKQASRKSTLRFDVCTA